MARRDRRELGMTAAGRRLVLRNALEAHGLTQASLARRLDVSRPAIARAIRGDLVSARIRRKLATLAGIPLAELYPPRVRNTRATIVKQSRGGAPAETATATANTEA